MRCLFAVCAVALGILTSRGAGITDDSDPAEGN